MNIRLHSYSFDKKNLVLFSTSTYRLHSYLTNNKINILKLFFFFCIIVLFDHKVIPNYCFFKKKWLNYFFSSILFILNLFSWHVYFGFLRLLGFKFLFIWFFINFFFKKSQLYYYQFHFYRL